MVVAPYGKFVAASKLREGFRLRLAVANLIVAHLAVKAAQRGIIVHRTALDALHGRIGLPAQIQKREIVSPDIPPQMLLEVDMGGRIQKNVDDLSECIPRRLRADDRQNEIRSFADTPDRQCLTEI